MAVANIIDSVWFNDGTGLGVLYYLETDASRTKMVRRATGQ